MKRRLVLEFTKMHGAGNDFIIIDNRFYHFTDEELSELARQLCPRRFGVGADGLMALAVPQEDADYRMRFFNADGSLAPMCGNGARCLAKFARLSGLKKERMRFESDAGIFEVVVPEAADEQIQLVLPPPSRFIAEVPVSTDIQQALGPVHYLWVGTDHAVCFVESLEQFPVHQWGERIRHDPAFGEQGTNVMFVAVEGPDTLALRSYERGVEGETLACGTGAVAAATVARLLGLIQTNRVSVKMPGGVVWVGGLEASQEGLVLEGPVTYVFRGSLEIG